MKITLRVDGTITVPMRAVADDGTIGDGVRVVKPSDPDYAEVLETVELTE